VQDTIVDRVHAESAPPKLVVLDLSSAPHVDMHAAHMLAGLADELAAAGVRLEVVEARASVRERFRGGGADAKLGTVDRFTSVADAVEGFKNGAG
jgi:MFS superfamily sulfate permease-like transporter